MVYGGDTSSALVSGLAPNTTYDVTVAAYTSKDIELSPIGPVTATTGEELVIWIMIWFDF